MGRYSRVIPRDLFNESNLLKCLGKLALHAETTEGLEVKFAESAPDGWNICQRWDDGSLYADAVQVRLHGVAVTHGRPLNSREAWPLWVLDPSTDEYVTVFADDGTLAEEFLRALWVPAGRAMRDTAKPQPVTAHQLQFAERLAMESAKGGTLAASYYPDACRGIALRALRRPVGELVRNETEQQDTFAAFYGQALAAYEGEREKARLLGYRAAREVPAASPNQREAMAAHFGACLVRLYADRVMGEMAALLNDPEGAKKALFSFNRRICEQTGAGKGAATTEAAREAYRAAMRDERRELAALVTACHRTGLARDHAVQGMEAVLKRAQEDAAEAGE